MHAHHIEHHYCRDIMNWEHVHHEDVMGILIALLILTAIVAVAIMSGEMTVIGENATDALMKYPLI